MAQLRQDFDEFVKRQVEVLVIGPENLQSFRDYWQKNNLPFKGLPDPDHKVLNLYGQQVKLLKYGRMPAQAIIDKKGMLRFLHYGDSMQDIPNDQELLKLLDEMVNKK